MQSWGVESQFSVRDSGREPSKSGVIGLLCAAMGRPREADVTDLARLRMGVRVDREGTLRYDYQIAQNVLSSVGKGLKNITSNRYYLADATFLVGVESDNLDWLNSLQQALQHPVWTIFLGRKAFAPAAPIYLKGGLREDEALEVALQTFGWIFPWPEGKAPTEVRMVIEHADGEQSRPDVPVSFGQRTFSSRRVKTSLHAAPNFYIQEGTDESIETGS